MAPLLVIAVSVLVAIAYLIFVIRPDLYIKLLIKSTKLSYRFFGFEIEMKPMPKAKWIWRLWALFMFVVMIIATAAMYFGYILCIAQNK